MLANSYAARFNLNTLTERLLDIDCRLIVSFAKILDCIPGLSWLQFRSSMEQFSSTMAAQANLDTEAYHLEVLNHNFRRWGDVSFPRPIFASSSVIVETFERGKICTEVFDMYDNLANKFEEELNNSEKLDSVGDNKGKGRGYEIIPIPLSKFIVTRGLSVYLQMLLVDNLMHADLHPGNMMIDYHLHDMVTDSFPQIPVGGCRPEKLMTHQKSSKEIIKKQVKQSKNRELVGKFSGKLVLVDAGMVAQLDESEKINFIGLIAAMGEGDGRTAAEAILRFSTSEYNYNNFNAVRLAERKEQFIQDIITLFSEICNGYGTNVQVGEVLRGVLQIVRKHHVRIDANYATLVVNVLCIESISKRVCPSYNTLDASKSLLRSYRHLYSGNDIINKGPKHKVRFLFATF